ncbi:MAG: alpha/beta hydrolase [Rhodospirillales bacterium]|jgi:acetyl esterase|nr:alpha/beta hydrolase [Rhodospirillales bacterium]
MQDLTTPQFTAEDLEYFRHGETPLLARLYRPRGPGPFPAVVDVHGGAWVAGDRLMNRAASEHLAAAGIVVLSLDFRVPPADPYPASIADINAGIRWLKSHAAEFGCSAERVGGIGSSSGGQQLMLSAMRPFDPRYAALEVPGAAGVDATIAYAVACWPVIDPLARYRMAKERNLTRLIENHDAYWGSEAAMIDGSPQHILDRGEAARLPPTLILQGTADENVSPALSGIFAEAYRRAGGAIELVMFEGEPHTFIANDPTAPAAQDALACITEFILRQVG